MTLSCHKPNVDNVVIPGCKPYAEAVANGEAINKCAPGGEDTIKKIAELLMELIDSEPIDENHEQADSPDSNRPKSRFYY